MLFRFTDLFAGIGGTRLAFEAAGGECVFSSEINKFSRQTYYENFLDLPEGDIMKIPEDCIPDHQILTAGFPCQPFSISGVSKRNSLDRPHGFDCKEKGQLFFKIIKILAVKLYRLKLILSLCQCKDLQKNLMKLRERTINMMILSKM